MTGALGGPGDGDGDDPDPDPESEPVTSDPWPASEFELFPCPNCGSEEWVEVGSGTDPETEGTVTKRWACRDCGTDLTMDIQLDDEHRESRQRWLSHQVERELADRSVTVEGEG